jgi:hypothetical protein
MPAAAEFNSRCIDRDVSVPITLSGPSPTNAHRPAAPQGARRTIPMKRTLLFLLSIFCLSRAFAGPAEDRVLSAQGRKETIALLRQGKLIESKQRLNMALPAGAPVSTNELALGRQWVTIAFHFHTRGETTLARQAAAEAVTLATSASRMTGISSERASLLTNTGLVCERVLRNRSQAKAFYDASLIAQPASDYTKQLQRKADEKLKKQATAKAGGS